LTVRVVRVVRVGPAGYGPAHPDVPPSSHALA